jgi:DNA repair protein RecO (recombination protein O)
MLSQTKAIILRTVPYGETSLVVTALTQVYGLQSYMVKGARSTGKKGQSLRPYLQPGALLDLVVYHHPTDHLQYIREMRWARVYQRVLSSVLHHAVATWMVELLTKCIRQSEPNPELFERAEQYLTLIDEAEPGVVANLPLHFALYLAGELGFRPENNYSENCPVFNLAEGKFMPEGYRPDQSIEHNGAHLTHLLLSAEHPVTLYRIKMSREQRRALLQAYEAYFSIHVEGFGHMRSLEVLRQLF